MSAVSPLLPFLLAVVVSPSIHVVANAATLSVETTVDELEVNGLCSLREAIYSANDDGGQPDCVAGEASVADRIVIPPGRYELTPGQRRR